MHRHQLRALSSIARYLPVFIGAMLSTAFALSVTTDSLDIALAAWQTGSELLGLYGGFGVVALPFVFFATAYLRRGKPRPVVRARLRRDELAVELTSGRTLFVPTERIRHGFSHPTEDGLVRVSLELEGGLTDGDRVVLDLDPKQAAPLVRRFVGDAPHYDLSRTSMTVGLAMFVFSAFAGVVGARVLLGRVLRAAEPLGISALEVTSWHVGLIVATTGLVHAALSLLLAPKSVVVGVDGLRIESIGGRRFLPYGSIRAVSASRWALVVVHERGRAVLWAPGVDAATLRSLADLADERRSVCRATSPTAPVSRPETIRRWREAIMKRVDGLSYRQRSISNDDLTRILTSPAVSRDLRIEAALALASRGSKGDRSRIRLAAATVADDATRVLLERIAEDEASDSVLESLLLRGKALR